MNIQLNYILLVCFIAVGIKIQSQNNEVQLPNVMPPSPEAANLGNYFETPPAESTGIPSISIPIFELSGKKPISVSINYHAGGITTSTIASRVGLGWSLNAGGKITRSVRGTADSPIGFINPVYTLQAFENLTPENKKQVVRNNPDLDLQSDMYLYNAPGISGGFFLEQATNGSINVIQNPKTDNKIILDLTSSGVLKGWQIISTDGTTYYFGKGKDGITTAIDEVSSIVTQGSYSQPTSYEESWHLLDIETINNEVISFSYEEEYIEYERLIGQERVIAGPINTNLTFSLNDDTTQRLKTIESNMGKIEFTYGENRQDLKGDVALTEVELFDAFGDLVDSYQFTYDYFQRNDNNFENTNVVRNPNERKKRLKLETLQQNIAIIAPGENKEYSFEYYDSPVYMLPDRLTYAQDFWGYFNGKSNTTLYPNYTYTNSAGVSTTINGSDRKVDEDYAKSCILEKITYPTGGYTEFDYSSNRSTVFATQFGSNYVTFTEDILYNENTSNFINNESGLIDIVYSNGDKPNQITFNVAFNACKDPFGFECTYLDIFAVYDSGAETPLLANQSQDIIDFSYTVPNDVNKIKIVKNSSGQNSADINISAIRADESLGDKVGGLRVDEIRKYNSTNVLASKISFQYNNGICLNPPVLLLENGAQIFENINCQYESYDVLKSNTVYPLTSSGSVVLYQNVTTINNSTSYGKIEREYSPAHLGGLTGVYQGGTYPCQNNICINELIPVSNFSHREGLLINEKKYEETAGGFEIKEESTYHYAFQDNINEYYYAPSIVYKYLPNVECASLPRGEILISQSFSNTSDRHYLSRKDTKTYFGTNNYVLQETEYQYDAGYSSRMLHKREIMTSNKTNETIIIETDFPEDRPINEAFMSNLIAANRIAEPIEIRNYRGNSNGANQDLLNTQRTSYASFNSIILPKQIKTAKDGNTLEDRIVYHKYDTYGNPQEVSQKDGMHITYVWGYNGQYPIAKIENSTYASLPSLKRDEMIALSNNPNTTQQQLLNKMEEFRSSINTSSQPDRMVTTMTYEPLVGVTTITDPKGDTKTYFYDDFGRLEMIKDKQGKILQEYDYNYRN